jgi:hypothetical protein
MKTLKLMLAFHKGQFWAHCCSYYSLMICLMLFLPPDVRSTAFADDASASTGVETKTGVEPVISDCNDRFSSWTKQNGQKFNEDKSVFMVFFTDPPPSENIKFSSEAKMLGLTLDSNLKFETHVENVASKMKSGIYCLIAVRDWAGISLSISVYHALINSHLSYSVLCWGHNIAKGRVNRLVRLQKWALRVIYRKDRRYSCRELFVSSNVMTFPCLYIYNALLYTHSLILNGTYIRTSNLHEHNLRSSENCYIHYCRYKSTQNYINTAGKLFYNALP